MSELRAHHAPKGELRCIATEIVREPGSSPALLMAQDCTEQNAPPPTFPLCGVASFEPDPMTSIGRFSRINHNTLR